MGNTTSTFTVAFTSTFTSIKNCNLQFNSYIFLFYNGNIDKNIRQIKEKRCPLINGTNFFNTKFCLFFLNGFQAGRVMIEIRPDWAPLGSARFLELMEIKFFKGNKFFRAIKVTTFFAFAFAFAFALALALAFFVSLLLLFHDNITFFSYSNKMFHHLIVGFHGSIRHPRSARDKRCVERPEVSNKRYNKNKI